MVRDAFEVGAQGSLLSQDWRGAGMFEPRFTTAPPKDFDLGQGPMDFRVVSVAQAPFQPEGRVVVLGGAFTGGGNFNGDVCPTGSVGAHAVGLDGTFENVRFWTVFGECSLQNQADIVSDRMHGDVPCFGPGHHVFPGGPWPAHDP